MHNRIPCSVGLPLPGCGRLRGEGGGEWHAVRGLHAAFAPHPNPRSVPKPAVSNPSKQASLFDHIVGENVELRRNCEPNSVCGLAINDQIEPRGLLDWKVTRFRTLENLVNE